MQAKREMVRDIYSQRIFKYTNNTKKCLQKAKGSHNLKKEIVKLRDYFQTLNLENQIGIEHDNRNKAKTLNINMEKDDIVTLNNNENKLIEDEIITCYISQATEDENTLLIENDHDFRLIRKDKTNKLQVENIYNNSSMLRVNKKLKRGINCCHDITEQNEGIASPRNECIENKKENLINDKHLPKFNEYKNDLQSLLIMLTINSNTVENTEPEQDLTMQMEQTQAESEQNTSKIRKHDSEKVEAVSENNQTEELIQLLNITSLRKGLSYKQKYLAKKVIKKWKSFVLLKKENRTLEYRQITLNNFFDKLSKKVNNTVSSKELAKKAKTCVRDYGTYQHRYKIQKYIIALQKAKLDEQNKLIEELKYNKIIEASRQSLDTMREDVRRTYYDIDKHLKPKIKCLTNELKIKEFEEPSLVLHCLKVPQFLQRMEARAREREEKHAIIRERRKQMEEERIRLKQQAELAKTEMDKEEKTRRIKDLREKRKKEKIENIRKKQHAERMRALIVMSDLHNERKLMNKYGIIPWKLLMEIKKDNIEKAQAHYKFQSLKNIFLHWMWYTEDMSFERNYKADDFYRKKIMSKVFNRFKKNHYYYILKKQVAEDYYDLYLTQLIFRKLREAVVITKKEFQIKWMNASLYYNSNVLFKTFTCWRSLPALNALKREQDARKLKWREKVLLVVPDYKPPED